MAGQMVRTQSQPQSQHADYKTVLGAFTLSGEPMASQVSGVYGTQKPQYNASEIALVNVQKREYQKEYMEYWNSTSSLTGTGRPVDAVISPLAPFAAARPNMYDYYGTSCLEAC
jgi:amidase